MCGCWSQEYDLLDLADAVGAAEYSRWNHTAMVCYVAACAAGAHVQVDDFHPVRCAERERAIEAMQALLPEAMTPDEVEAAWQEFAHSKEF